MAKADLVAELKELTGKEVNKDAYTEKQLEQMVKEAKEKSAPTPQDTSGASADTSSTPEDTSSTPEGTSSTPEDTSSTPEGTSSTPEGTSSTPEGTSSTGDLKAYLGASSPAGRLVLGGVTLRQLRANEDPENAAVSISREQLDQYAKEYDIKVVEG